MTDLFTANQQTAASKLAGVIGQLPASRQSFARDLIASVAKYGKPSEKQAIWLEKLYVEATTERAPAAEIGDLTGVMELFDKAKKHLKHPAVLLRVGDRELKLSVAGAAARVPGSINVATSGGYGNNDWFGRILTNGQFEPSRLAAPDGLVDSLRAFAQRPAEVAAAYGRLTGRCCFCNLALTDERSTQAGYGQTCAKNYGLPWGGKTLAEQNLAELDLRRTSQPAPKTYSVEEIQRNIAIFARSIEELTARAEYRDDFINAQREIHALKMERLHWEGKLDKARSSCAV